MTMITGTCCCMQRNHPIIIYIQSMGHLTKKMLTNCYPKAHNPHRSVIIAELIPLLVQVVC